MPGAATDVENDTSVELVDHCDVCVEVVPLTLEPVVDHGQSTVSEVRVDHDGNVRATPPRLRRSMVG